MGEGESSLSTVNFQISFLHPPPQFSPRAGDLGDSIELDSLVFRMRMGSWVWVGGWFHQSSDERPFRSLEWFVSMVMMMMIIICCPVCRVGGRTNHLMWIHKSPREITKTSPPEFYKKWIPLSRLDFVLWWFWLWTPSNSLFSSNLGGELNGGFESDDTIS